MKTRILIITAIFVSVQFLLYVVPAYAQGGAINMESDLAPSYGLDVADMRLDSVFVAVPLTLGIISLILLITHLILKRKKIPSRPYVILIAAAIMLFLGIPNFIQGIMLLFMISINEHLMNLEYIFGILPFVLLSFVLVGGGAVLFVKSKLIRNFIEGK